MEGEERCELRGLIRLLSLDPHRPLNVMKLRLLVSHKNLFASNHCRVETNNLFTRWHCRGVERDDLKWISDEEGKSNGERNFYWTLISILRIESMRVNIRAGFPLSSVQLLLFLCLRVWRFKDLAFELLSLSHSLVLTTSGGDWISSKSHDVSFN